MPRSARAQIRVTFNQKSAGSAAFGGGTAAVSLGRSANKYVTSDFGELPQVVADRLRKTVEKENRSYFFRIAATELAKQIAENIDKELLKVGQFMATHLIGKTSQRDYGGSTPINVPELDEAGFELEWRNLANITVRKKSANKQKFFLHTTALREEIKAKAGRGLIQLNKGFKTGGSFQGAVTYGPVRIRPYYYQSESGRRVYKIADIEVNLLAQANARDLRAIADQRVFDQSKRTMGDMPALARMMGLSPEAIKKLEGGVIDRNRIKRRNRSGFMIGSFQNQYTQTDMNFYRPMLEPAVAYFFQVKVPRAIERVIKRYRRGGTRT